MRNVWRLATSGRLKACSVDKTIFLQTAGVLKAYTRERWNACMFVAAGIMMSEMLQVCRQEDKGLALAI